MHGYLLLLQNLSFGGFWGLTGSKVQFICLKNLHSRCFCWIGWDCSVVCLLISFLTVPSCRENGDGSSESLVGEGGCELPLEHDELRGAQHHSGLWPASHLWLPSFLPRKITRFPPLLLPRQVKYAFMNDGADVIQHIIDHSQLWGESSNHCRGSFLCVV